MAFPMTRAVTTAMVLALLALTRTAEAEPLDEERAVALALERSPELAAARAREDVAAHTIHAAGELSTSELRLNDLNRADLDDDSRGVDVTLRLRLPEPGFMQARAAAPAIESAIAQWGTAAVAWAVEVDVRARFAALAIQQGRLDAQRAITDAYARQVDALKAQGDAGAATALDLALATVDYEDAAARQGELAAELATAKAAILTVVGLDPDQPTPLVPTPLTPLAPFPDGEAAMAQAAQAHPAIRAAEAEVARAALDARLARAARLPYLDFVDLGYELAPAGAPPQNQGLSLQVSLGLPPVGQTSRAASRASAELALAQREAEAVKAAVDSDVREALAALQGQAEGLERYGALMAAADEALAHTQALVTAGEADLTALAEMEVKAARLQLRRLDREQAYVTALRDLRLAVGGPLPTPGAADGP